MVRKITLLLVFFLSSCTLFAQGAPGPVPESWDLKLLEYPETIQLSPLDFSLIAHQDSLNDRHKNNPWRYGIERAISLDIRHHGLWTELPNGGKIWQAVISSPQALNLSVNFSEFNLPKGSRLQLYNSEHSDLTDTFTSTDNNDKNQIGTWFVQGDTIWLEYYQPPGITGTPNLKVLSVIHGYRMGKVFTTENGSRGFDTSGDCNYDVNCPVGEDFDTKKEILKKAVAMLNLGNGFLCSAVLINNTQEDKTPYVLTANHCLENSNPALWSFRFNWVSPMPSCGTGEPSGDLQTNFTMSGAQLISNNSLSDFALVKLNNDIPDSWDVAFAGWDNSETDPLFEVGIHHPNGDIMKICRDDSGAEKIDANGTKVWLIGGGQHGVGNGWELGTTETGSSGSPLFNEDGKIIGQLYAGGAGCDGVLGNHEYDLYGRFGVSWDGTLPEKRLKDWLDPGDSGQTSIGTLQNILNVPNFEYTGDLKIYPNPANHTLTVENYRYPRLSYVFSNIMGQEIGQGDFSSTLNSLSVESLPEGIYLLLLNDGDSGDSMAKKIVVKH